MAISRLLVEDLTEASASSSAVSRANTSRRPANSSVSPGLDMGSGLKCYALLAKQDPMRSWSTTLLTSPFWGSTLCSLAWKASATPSGRILFQLQASELGTTEKERSYRGYEVREWTMLSTPTASQIYKPLRPPTRSELEGKHGRCLVADVFSAWNPGTGERGMLNPQWVETLMGFPENWTNVD